MKTFLHAVIKVLNFFPFGFYTQLFFISVEVLFLGVLECMSFVCPVYTVALKPFLKEVSDLKMKSYRFELSAWLV